jgi:hypothetical protein
LTTDDSFWSGKHKEKGASRDGRAFIRRMRQANFKIKNPVAKLKFLINLNL